MPFDWGRNANDCVSFAASAVEAQTGTDPLARGGTKLRWSSKLGALRILKRLGGLEAAIDARCLRIAPAAAMRGDIAGVADDELGIRLLIVEGATLAGPGERGIKRVPRAAMVAAWSADETPDE